MRVARAAGRKVVFDIDYRPNLWGLAGHGAGEERYIKSSEVTERLQRHPAAMRSDRRHRGGDDDRRRRRRPARGAEGGARVEPGDDRAEARADGLRRLPRRDPRLRSRTASRGRAFRSRSITCSAPATRSCPASCAAGCATSRSRPAAPTPTPAAPSRCRACCARPNIRPGPSSAASSKHGSPHRALRHDETLNHIHWATTRRPEPPTIMALAIDHRAQLEKIADDAGAPRERISAFKLLAVEAAAKVAAGRPGFGMLLDGKYGREALFRAVDHDFWIGRPVEEPGSRPLDFEFGGSLGAKLRNGRSRHTIKCLCFYHPDDPPEMKARQERELLRLHDAARTIGRELLIEIIASKNGPVDDRTIARVIERLYAIGIKPDWWKLEGQASEAAWSNIAQAIEAGDPLCRGDRAAWPRGAGGGSCAGLRDRPTSAGSSKASRSAGRSSSSRRSNGSPAGSATARRSTAWRERFRACAICGAIRPRGRVMRNSPRSRRGAGRRGTFDQSKEVCAMKTIRLTAAQAMVRFLARPAGRDRRRKQRLFEGVFAIFGHGNVAGLGEALYAARDALPTYRAHNEQAMAHAAIAFAKASRRQRMMACTTSIGPGATNMVTAAAIAAVNRLPVLLIPGDVFASRRPDPVLQQVEDFGDGTVSANDCFRPVSRYFDRITRPEQIVPALNRAIAVLTDPAECGPVTLAFCQDVQAEAYDYPASFFDERVHRLRRAAPDPREVEDGRRAPANGQEAVRDLRRRRPLFRRRARADRVLRQARNPGRRDPGRQVGDAGRSSAGDGRGRRHRHRRGQCARGAGRRDRRRRHAVRRLHHRLVGAVQESATAASSASTCSRSTRLKHRALPVVGDARTALAALDVGARRLEGAALVERGGRQGQGRMGGDGRALHRADQRAAADRRGSARRAHARRRKERRRRLRRRRAARRIAQALAGRRAARLSRRIRLFLHGLRDRRRDRRQDGAAGSRGGRDASATARI